MHWRRALTLISRPALRHQHRAANASVTPTGGMIGEDLRPNDQQKAGRQQIEAESARLQP
jgi:hypothetical protein